MVEITPENEPTFGAIPTDGASTHPHVEAAVTEDGAEVMTDAVQKKGTNRGFIALILILVIGVGAYFLLFHKTSGSDLAKIQGTVALSAQDLHAVVAANHLTVYWAGPLAGAKYALIATNPNLIYLKYLPGGVGINDTTTPFRTVGTYVQKNAFAVGQYTGSTAGHVGMLNPDGNSVFYADARLTNVYVGIKGKDIQVEIYDPVAGTALALALNQNQIVPVS